MRTAIYPGSFDPATLGHLDIIERASLLFDHLIVTVMGNHFKVPTFTTAERTDFLKRMTASQPNVSIESFDGLLADFTKIKGAQFIVKGLRAVSDFETEFNMALGNRILNPQVDTVFLMSSDRYMCLSSSMVKDIAHHGGSISGFVPEIILPDVVSKLKKNCRD